MRNSYDGCISAEVMNITCSSERTNRAHTEGCNTIARGTCSHAEGAGTIANQLSSHAEGNQTTANGESSHAEGAGTQANKLASHAEGIQTTAEGVASHAEGEGTIASGEASHVEGVSSRASANASHAEGLGTTASGDYSHAEGLLTTASGHYSHAEGLYTSTNNHFGSHIMGQFGDACANLSWFMANGSNLSTKSISAAIFNNGNAHFNSTTTPLCDFAEMFETFDGEPIDVGYFVTFDGDSDKIRKATANDDYILGIISATPAIIAGTSEFAWSNKYVMDQWGRVQYHDVTVPAVMDKDGRVIIPERIESQPVLNPEWKKTREYIPRSKRPEWVAVGLLGQLLVRDDGTSKAGSYCKSNNEGIATAFNTGYRVIKRTGPNQVLVLLK